MLGHNLILVYNAIYHIIQGMVEHKEGDFSPLEKLDKQ